MIQPQITATERRYQLDGIELAALHWGDPEAPLIVAVHGWLDNAQSFAPIAPLLCQAGYQVLAVDWPGHGHSGHRGAAASYAFLDYLHELHQLMLQLRQRPVCLLGHSMGGILAGIYLGTYPKQCQNLAVIEALGPITQQADNSPEQLRKGIDSRLRANAPSGDLDLTKLVKARQALTDLPEPLLKPLLQRNLIEQEGAWHWRSDSRLRRRSLIMMTEDQAKSFCEGIEVPTLFLFGQHGFPELKQAWPQRQCWFGQAKLATVAGNHHCHMTDPTESAQQIISFLAN